MNLFSIASFIIAAIILTYAMVSTGNISIFRDFSAFLLVIGGTIVAASISFQMDRFLLMFKVFFFRVIRGKKENYVNLIENLMALADAHRAGPLQFDELVKKATDPFLKEAMQIIQDDILDHETLIRILRLRVNSIFQKHVDEMIKFKSVGRYPPAFGLIGTTLSMISLLEKLGSAGSQKLIGPSMALGLVATFYGLVLANVIFNPIAENLHDSAKETRLKNIIIVEGVRLILQKTNPIALAEELNSFLLPSERIDWKKVTKTSNPGKAA